MCICSFRDGQPARGGMRWPCFSERSPRVCFPRRPPVLSSVMRTRETALGLPRTFGALSIKPNTRTPVTDRDYMATWCHPGPGGGFARGMHKSHVPCVRFHPLRGDKMYLCTYLPTLPPTRATRSGHASGRLWWPEGPGLSVLLLGLTLTLVHLSLAGYGAPIACACLAAILCLEMDVLLVCNKVLGIARANCHVEKRVVPEQPESQVVDASYAGTHYVCTTSPDLSARYEWQFTRTSKAGCADWVGGVLFRGTMLSRSAPPLGRIALPICTRLSTSWRYVGLVSMVYLRTYIVGRNS